mgnify:CR=1 FL=1
MPPLSLIPHGTPRLREPSTHYKTADIALVVFYRSRLGGLA